MKIDSDMISKRGLKLEINQKLNELISSGDGVNFTMFNSTPMHGA